MTNASGRILFMGTPDFAVPSLRALAAGPHQVVGVVTQPDRPQGRKRALTPSPVKRAAVELEIPVLQPNRVRESQALEQIAALRPDVLVTAAYGQLLPQRLLDLPTIGCVNVHASLLPRWRGAAPIHRAILAGDTETGVTLMEMVAALDAGPVLCARAVPIGQDDDVGVLHDRLAALGAQLLEELLPSYLAGDIRAVPQPEDGVTYAERLTRADEWLDFTRSAEEVHNHIRGLSPWPGAAAHWQGGDLKIWSAARCSDAAELIAMQSEIESTPGTLITVGGVALVRCADGWLHLQDVQPAGKRRMAAADWLRGSAHRMLHLSSGAKSHAGDGGAETR